jgi:RNA polymerase sigma-70 factor (ECF subfamily)
MHPIGALLRKEVMTLNTSSCALPWLVGDIIPAMPRTSSSADTETTRNTQLRHWVLLMAGGDEAALGQLYDATLSRVYGVALRVTGRKDLAEEVAVETFWQAWREATRFDGSRGEVMAWLLMICRSRALDALRRKDSAESHPEPETLVTEPTDHAGTPLDQLLLAEQAGMVGDALKTLTPIQRQMIALAFFKDLSHQEICDHTGLPLGTVKSHLKRAQDGLKSALCVTRGAQHG